MRKVAVLCVATAMAQDGPVKKVITLLEKMKTETEESQTRDLETYKKLQCWCKKTKEDTNNALEKARVCIATETGVATAKAGEHAGATQKAKTATTEIKKTEETLAAATVEREKEAVAFSKLEKDLIKTIGALKSAVTVLSKHNFLQKGDDLKSVTTILAKQQTRMTPSQRSIVAAFLEQPTAAKYSSQSGQIFGILNNMLENTDQDLKEAVEEESNNKKTYAEAKDDLTETINVQQGILNTARVKAADAEKAQADAEAELAACQKTQENMEKVLQSADNQCTAADGEQRDRAIGQQQELEAINQAIGILNNSDAFSAFAKTTDKTEQTLFLQTSLKKLVQAKAVQKAVTLLKRSVGDNFFDTYGMGRAARNVAAMLQNDNIQGSADKFDIIVKAVEKQIEAKKTLLANKTNQKDSCVEQKNNEQANLVKASGLRDRAQALSESLAAEIGELVIQIAEDQKEKKTTDDSTMALSQERSQANADYIQEMEENRAAIALLAQAREVIAGVYGGLVNPEFMQQDPTKAEGITETSTYQQSEGGNKVLVMMDTIISDVKGEMKVAQTSENAAQKAYETQVKNNNDAVAALKAAITARTGVKAEKETAKINAETARDQHIAEATAATENLAANAEACNFLVENFKTIMDNHQAEVDGLVQAKTILANVIADLKAE